MLRCHVVLNKRLLSEIVLLIRIWVFEFCHNFSSWVLSQFEFWILLHFEFCQTELIFVPIQVFFSFFLQFKLMSFVTILVFEFYHNLIVWALSQFQLLNFFTIWVEVCNNLYFQVLSQFEFSLIFFLTLWVLCFVSRIFRFFTIWVFEFCHNLS